MAIDYKAYFSSNPLILAAIVAGVAIGLTHLFFGINVPEDVAAYYGPMVEAFSRGEWQEAFLENVPPLIPLLAGIVRLTGISAFHALIIVSAGFYLLTLWPLYKFMRLFVTVRQAGLGCFLYIIAPKIIQMGCTGLLNSGRNFFFITASWLLLSYVRKSTFPKLLLLALSLAGLTLVRGEGIIYLPLFLVWFVILQMRYSLQHNQTFAKSLGISLSRLAAVIVFILIVLSPRINQIYQCTGIPAVDIRQADMIAGILDNSPRFVDLSNDAESDEERGAELTATETFRPKWHLLRSEISVTNGELYLWLALFGLILLWRQRRLTLDHLVIFSFVLWNVLIFLVVALNVRYFTLNILLLMPLTVYGLMKLYLICRQRRLQYLFFAIATFLVAWQIYCGSIVALDRQHEYESDLNQWLSSNNNLLIQAAGKTDIDRRLVIFSNRPQFSFRAHADWVKPVWRKNHWILPPVEVLQAQNVDIAIIRNTSEFSGKVATSPHFKLLANPYSDKVGIFVFRPVAAAIDNMPKNEPETDDDGNP